MLRAAWKSLLGRKLRLVMSTSAIVLGVAFVAGSLIFTDTLGRSFTALFASSVGDVVVRPAGGAQDGQPTTRTVPASVLHDLARVPGAARVDGNVRTFGVFVVGKDGKVVGGQGAPGIGLNYTGAPAGHGLKGLTVVDGRPPRHSGQVALDRKTAQRAGYRIGDHVHLVTTGKRAVLHPVLVGLAAFGDGGSTNGATITLFDTATAQRLFLGGRHAFSDAWVTAEPGVSEQQLRDQVAAALPKGYDAVTGDAAAKQEASDLQKALSFITTFLLIFAGIALVVGSFLIVNTFSILVAQRGRELALLRALGASRGQVTRSVLFEAVVLGLVGSTLGLGLGVLLAMGIRALFATFGLDLSGAGLVFAPRTVVASYAVGILVTVLAAYLPARRSARIPPVAALRDDVALPESALHRRLVVGVVLVAGGIGCLLTGLYGAVASPAWWVGGGVLATLLGVAAAGAVIGRPFMAATGLVYRRLFGTVGLLAGQNAVRNPRRTAATASALMIGLALVTTMAIVGASAKRSVDHAIAQNFLGDLVVSNALAQPFSPSIGDRVKRTPGVAAVTRVRYAFGRVDGHREGLVGVSAGSLRDVVRIRMVAGSASALHDGTVLVSRRQARGSGLHVGDTVSFLVPTGTRSYRVVGVYAPNPMLGYSFTTTLGTLARAGFPAEDNYLLVSVGAGASPTHVQRAIEQQTAALPTVTVKNQAEYAAAQRAPIDKLLLLIYALLGLALVIAVLGIVNTLALSVIERTREVGLLRAVGLSRAQLRRMVRLEAVAIAVLGALLGVGLGVLFGVALMTSLKDQGLDVTAVPVAQLAGFVAASGLVGVLAAVLPARRAARLDVLAAIATE